MHKKREIHKSAWLQVNFPFRTHKHQEFETLPKKTTADAHPFSSWLRDS
jgi:hypothetical protein